MNKFNLKTILLDFDGTIINSNDIKDKAFETIFYKWPEHKYEMMKYHISNNHVDRNGKFKYFVEKVLKIKNSETLISDLTKKFSDLTFQNIINAKMIKGSFNFIKYFHNKLPCYLISATPQAELKKIISTMGLNIYFKNIYGAPLNKEKVFRKILKFESIHPNQAVCIGDSQEDFSSAHSIGIPFIQRISDRKILGCNSFASNNFFDIKQYIISNYEN